MEATFKIKDPENVEFTMSFTMSLKAWRQIREAVSKGAESIGRYGHTLDFAYEISQLVDAAEEKIVREPVEVE